MMCVDHYVFTTLTYKKRRAYDILLECCRFVTWI